MSLQDVLVGFCTAVLVASATLVLIRIIRGPSVLDRTVASEVMISIIVCALGLEAAVNRHSTTLPILVSLSLLGFVGSVAIARFVARDHDRGTDEPSPRNFLGRSGEDAPARALGADDAMPVQGPEPGAPPRRLADDRVLDRPDDAGGRERG
ncbi:monovalent cation/H+ antiporter complex subunit F [Auraticoccus monumenti]|uniref:Multisubunit Na+/H+ antiporter, MnhF subunit n=1 Tax=Auraticoccus monumenti TaxID=675864 RepID=A0A1G6VG61_9ACTN|nr:monovalent cation/H+ antiporter complex subunit F [Auraticoccus monumenti]SDD52508.1 Multisubunit Na+/H+ antiporter, MnhF subunit [Auraticoccus monumenti]